jgi:uncharacterized protein YbcI
VNLSGQQLADAASAMVTMKAQFFGRGADEAKSYVNDEFLIVVMKGCFLQFENELIARGRDDAVRDLRLTWQAEMAPEIVGRIEEITAMKVLDYHSQVMTKADVALEMFLLGPEGR